MRPGSYRHDTLRAGVHMTLLDALALGANAAQRVRRNVDQTLR